MDRKSITDLLCEETHHHPKKVALASKSVLTNEQIDSMSQLFRSIADPTRLSILSVLRMGEMCVCDIAETLNLTQSAVSHQLKNLREVNAVKSRREGKQVLYSLHDSHVIEIFSAGVVHVTGCGCDDTI